MILRKSLYGRVFLLKLVVVKLVQLFPPCYVISMVISFYTSEWLRHSKMEKVRTWNYAQIRQFPSAKYPHQRLGPYSLPFFGSQPLFQWPGLRFGHWAHTKPNFETSGEMYFCSHYWLCRHGVDWDKFTAVTAHVDNIKSKYDSRDVVSYLGGWHYSSCT